MKPGVCFHARRKIHHSRNGGIHKTTWQSWRKIPAVQSQTRSNCCHGTIHQKLQISRSCVTGWVLGGWVLFSKLGVTLHFRNCKHPLYTLHRNRASIVPPCVPAAFYSDSITPVAAGLVSVKPCNREISVLRLIYWTICTFSSTRAMYLMRKQSRKWVRTFEDLPIPFALTKPWHPR